MEWLPIREFAEATGRSVPGIHKLIASKDPRITYIRPGHVYLISQKSVAGLRNGKAAPKKKRKAR